MESLSRSEDYFDAILSTDTLIVLTHLNDVRDHRWLSAFTLLVLFSTADICISCAQCKNTAIELAANFLLGDCSQMVCVLLKVIQCADNPLGPVMETLHLTMLYTGWVVGLGVETPVHCVSFL